jgi:hypothetical protein
MKVKELIEELEKIQNKESEILIREYNNIFSDGRELTEVDAKTNEVYLEYF